jgi:cytochrome P450
MAFDDLLSLLTLYNAFLALITYVILQFLHQIIYYRYFHPLSKFPGPFWASVTRLWIAYHNLKGDEYQVVYELHKKYGPVIRVTPTLLLFSDATKIPEIYFRQSHKSLFYITGSFGKQESIFNMQDHRQHAHFRKIAAGPYSFTNIKKMEPLIDARIHEWTKELEERFVKTSKQFDFVPWATYFAYDVISEIGFGAPFGFTKTGSDIGGLIKGITDGLPAFGVVSRLYPFTYWMKNTWIGEKLLVPTSKDNNGFGAVMRFRDKLLKERLEDIEAGIAGGRVDLLQTFLNARTEDGKPLDADYIKVETLVVLLAGAETTGTAFQAILHFVLTSPGTYVKLMEEIDAATRSGKLSAIPQYSEVVENCPYYVACVKESMRLRPSTPNLFPRLVAEGGVTFYDRYIPSGKGIELSCNPWTVHRDENIYGPDAGKFRPDRWLESEEKKKTFDKYSMTFGWGVRSCLGKDIALMELYKSPLQVSL